MESINDKEFKAQKDNDNSHKHGQSVLYFLADGTGEGISKKDKTIVHHFLRNAEAATLFVKAGTLFVKYQGQNPITLNNFLRENPTYNGDFVFYLPGPGAKTGSFNDINYPTPGSDTDAFQIKGCEELRKKNENYQQFIGKKNPTSGKSGLINGNGWEQNTLIMATAISGIFSNPKSARQFKCLVGMGFSRGGVTIAAIYNHIMEIFQGPKPYGNFPVPTVAILFDPVPGADRVFTETMLKHKEKAHKKGMTIMNYTQLFVNTVCMVYSRDEQRREFRPLLSPRRAEKHKYANFEITRTILHMDTSKTNLVEFVLPGAHTDIVKKNSAIMRCMLPLILETVTGSRPRFLGENNPFQQEASLGAQDLFNEYFKEIKKQSMGFGVYTRKYRQFENMECELYAWLSLGLSPKQCAYIFLLPYERRNVWFSEMKAKGIFLIDGKMLTQEIIQSAMTVFGYTPNIEGLFYVAQPLAHFAKQQNDNSDGGEKHTVNNNIIDDINNVITLSDYTDYILNQGNKREVAPEDIQVSIHNKNLLIQAYNLLGLAHDLDCLQILSQLRSTLPTIQRENLEQAEAVLSEFTQNLDLCSRTLVSLIHTVEKQVAKELGKRKTAESLSNDHQKNINVAGTLSSCQLKQPAVKPIIISNDQDNDINGNGVPASQMSDGCVYFSIM